MTSLSLILSALSELGPSQLGLYALYRIGLRSGYYRRATGEAPEISLGRPSLDWLALPKRDELLEMLGKSGLVDLIAEANEVLSGKVRNFGADPPVPLQLTVPGQLVHWTAYDHSNSDLNEMGASDIKFTWETGRFGWAYTLARAYHLTSDERYPQTFWSYTETFLGGNPPYMGPHWVSAQEAALRLIALVFAARVFSGSAHTTPERVARLSNAVAAHAARIPPTLIYAHAQNNNHLLTEAAGLYTAGMALPEHPSAYSWRSLGWRWFNRGIASQVAPDGAYGQHSANYQRLMLQVALWMGKLTFARGQAFPQETVDRLAAATRWLGALLDSETGRVPNLGPNDGAYILPLTICPFYDYRPTLQAASLAFLGAPCVEPGAWDEMADWLVDEGAGKPGRAHPHRPPSFKEVVDAPKVIRLSVHPSWAYLRAAHFDGRPGHADQLHLDLWWRGLNVAQDPGTYLYNAPPPWDNALTRTQVHNTLTVNGEEQMLRAGRFLYLQRAQAQVLERAEDEGGGWKRLVAQHDGYRRLGLIHRRAVIGYEQGHWSVEDSLIPVGEEARSGGDATVEARLHWLLPDWDWEVDEALSETTMRLRSPLGELRLKLSCDPGAKQFQIVRAGELVYGTGRVEPILGWSSPTYGDKIPALSIRWTIINAPPIVLRSEWIFP